MEEDHHVIAYMDVERNRVEIRLTCTEEYHRLAKRFFKNALEFSELCKVAGSALQLKNMAVYANACLACELYLKCLLLAEEFNFYKNMRFPENKHSLYDLYNHLSKEGQMCLQRNCIVDEGCFEKELKSISKGFEVIRYIAECRGMMVNVVFLFSFLGCLEQISKYVIDRLETQ